MIFFSCATRIKALESPNKDDDNKWLTYWVVFATYSVIDFWADAIFRYFPFYWLLKVRALLNWRLNRTSRIPLINDKLCYSLVTDCLLGLVLPADPKQRFDFRVQPCHPTGVFAPHFRCRQR
jgi:hypothetical protein